jgi:hypothetical protein
VKEKAVPPDEDFPVSEGEAMLLPREPRGFAPEEMVRCEECLRANPPVRTNCMYCAALLPVTDASAALRKPTLRPLEKWEQGFNSIYIPGQDASADAARLEAIASLLRLSSEDVRRVFEATQPLPLARAATEEEALLIERRLEELGVRVLTVADAELALETNPPKRVRALELGDNALVAWPTGGNETLRAAWDEIGLLVVGRIVTRQVEVEERRGRRDENEIVETRELSNDLALLDIYSSATEGNWRIVAGNFDFSCLRDRKSLLASANFAKLRAELRARAPRARDDDSYARVRHALGAAWPLEQQTASRGWRRGGPGRISTEMVTTIDNERQFTRYSRLLNYLESRRTDAAA